jgi:hypothetical protein
VSDVAEDMAAATVLARVLAVGRACRHGRFHEPALLAAFVIGIGLAAVHWLGLVAAGALVGTLAPTVRRAVTLGATLGLVVLLTFVAYLAWVGAAAPFLLMGPITWLTGALAVGLPALGASLRGLG